MNSLIFTNNEKNYLVEFQSINGYESFIKKKNQIYNLLLKQISVAIIGIIISLYSKFFGFIVLFNFICFIIYRFYFIQIIETFIDYCKSIVKFEDFVKSLYKIPQIDKELLDKEIDDLIKLYSIYYPNENLDSGLKKFLLMKKKSFVNYFEEYEQIFKNKVFYY